MKSAIKFIFIFYFCLVFSQNFNAQVMHSSIVVFEIPTIKSRKMGPYIGFQRGRYSLIEFGGELQLKRVKLIHPKIHGFRFGPNYDFRENVLGFDCSYWYQQSRLGLTYGGNISHRTDFTHSRIGIAPVIGFRLLQFHLQTGYTFYTPVKNFTNYNRFFIALKFTLVNSRKIKMKK